MQTKRFTRVTHELMCLQQSDSAVVEQIFLIMSEYSSTSTWLGSKQKQQATAGVKVQTLDVFYQEHISSVATKLLW